MDKKAIYDDLKKQILTLELDSVSGAGSYTVLKKLKTHY